MNQKTKDKLVIAITRRWLLRGSVVMAFIVAQLFPVTTFASPVAKHPSARELAVTNDEIAPDDLNAVGSTFAQKNSMESVLITTEDGRDVWRSQSELELNGASTIKLMTALAVLKKLGPDYRFPTKITYRGTVDPQTETLHGDLYILGNDPTLSRVDIKQLTSALNQAGIRQVVGNVYVEPQFCLDRQDSGAARRSLGTVFNPPKRSRKKRKRRKVEHQPQAPALLPVRGSIKVLKSAPPPTTAVTSVDSASLRQILKGMLTSSDNYMAERLGILVGSASGLTRIMRQDYGLSAKLKLSTTSGLGVNRVTASDLEKVVRALVAELTSHNLTPDAIMAVGGEEGTLRRRFYGSEGSVIAKTGTLIQTDRGASALAGILHTANGETYYFVILHQRGSVGIFKKRENLIVESFQNLHGGAARFSFLPDRDIAKS